MRPSQLFCLVGVTVNVVAIISSVLAVFALIIAFMFIAVMCSFYSKSHCPS